MNAKTRHDDYRLRRERLGELSDEALHAYFWELANRIVEPLVAEARDHTSPSIERSVLLRMGFSSIEAKALVEKLVERGMLGRGAGRLLLELVERKGLGVREVGLALIAGEHWEDLRP